jgi:hypothetical protein
MFALLNGQNTWTRAKDYATEYSKAAKTASDNTKEMLASFDELNVISSESNSGNSNKTNLDYSKMFEEVSTFDESVKEWVPKIKEALSWIKDIIDTIWPVVEKIFAWIIDKFKEA